jgi:type I restriction enzyme S subunit
MKRVQQLISSHINIWATTETEKKSGRGRSSSNARKIYGIEKLRQLILDLAIRGKLVLQDPKDESAKELLLRIQDRLTSENKLGKKKGPQEFKEQQMPFELPKTWVCLKLRDTYQSISPLGKQLKTSQIKVKGKFPVIDQGQLYISGYTDINENVIKIPHPVIVFGDHTRNIKFINFDFVAGADGTKILAPILINPKFFYYQLLSYRVESKGYARHFKTLNENFIAIPPLTEQKRIVSKVDELMALCDQLEQKHINSQVIHEKLVKVLLEALTQSKDEVEFKDSWQRITKHFNTLFTTVDTINKLKHTIFKLAITGKLVPQDPNDEPISELFWKVKINKKKKTLLSITENEKLKKLPKGWEWLRLGFVGEWGSGSTPLRSNSNYYKGNIPWFKSGELNEDLIYKSEETITELAIKKCSLRMNNPGDILLAMYGANIGKTSILGVKGTTNQAVCACTPNEIMFNKYLLLTLKAMRDNFINQGAGGAQPNISKEKIIKTIVAVPPIKEQKRIVSKVDELIALCDELKSRIQQASLKQKQVADVLISQALN